MDFSGHNRTAGVRFCLLSPLAREQLLSCNGLLQCFHIDVVQMHGCAYVVFCRVWRFFFSPRFFLFPGQNFGGQGNSTMA